MKVTESIAQRRYNGVIDILKIFIETSHKRMMLNIAAGPHNNNSFDGDLSDCLNIVDALELAYKAGKNGEPWEVVTQKIDPYNQQP